MKMPCTVETHDLSYGLGRGACPFRDFRLHALVLRGRAAGKVLEPMRSKSPPSPTMLRGNLDRRPTRAHPAVVALACVISLLVATTASSADVPLRVAEPSGIKRASWPVTSGIPCAQGVLRDVTHCELFDAASSEIPLQTEALARWPDGSVRWLLVDFQTDLEAGEEREFSLRIGTARPPRNVEPPVVVRQEQDLTILDTGVLQIRLHAGEFRPLDEVWLDANRDGQYADDERVTGPSEAGIFLTAPDGQVFRADQSPASLLVEESGPLRACVRLEGVHASPGGSMFRYVLRLHAFRGQPLVRMHYTFINDQQDAMMAQVDGLELVVSHARADAQQVVLSGKARQPGHLFQIDDRQYELDGQRISGQALGWAGVSDGRLGFALGLREFWQNWPKAITAAAGQIRLGICPDFPMGLYDGQPLTEECKLYYYLLTGDRRAREVAILASDTMAEFCPTAYTDHIRNIGWPFHLVLDAYEATADPKYLAAATRQWEMLRKNFDPEQGWVVLLAYGHCTVESESGRCRGNNMYMLGFTLTALARYHALTNDPEVLRALSVGIDQMIREAWSEEHKSFYLTSCQHARSSPAPLYCSATFHAARAFAYESKLTKNREHRRILREALRTAILAGRLALANQEPTGQTGYYAGSFRFPAEALEILESE